ncbi:MAG: HD domain-containing protein [Armatimonadetes bacterium]|nr:HD domain-containing protein [Armatimonadota bacterium]CUU34412.1 HDIG domain-containing protein [Armatimonadetes bacterium DC]
MRIGRATLRRGRGQSGIHHRAWSLPVYWGHVAVGMFAVGCLTLLNGELRTLPVQWLERLVIAFAQVGLMIPLLHYLGLSRPTGLALRSPIAHSARETGIALLMIVGLASLLGVRLASAIADGDTLTHTHGFLSFAPLVAGAMLLSVLIHPLAALVVSAVLLLGVGLTLNLPPQTLGVVGLAAWASALAIAPMRRRAHMLWTGVLLSLLLAGASGLLALEADTAPLQAGSSAFWGAIGGIGAIALFWLGLNLIERPFRLATPLTLMELASPEHPLLRELREKAPGTYFHSQMVGQLAEEAALAIGADPLLARVAGYYHDIGKLTKPDFYIENQTTLNAHERINPALSARIIASHVRDGVDLAHQHRLPIALCDIIAQHHGTSLITYFYHQAIGDGHDPVLEQHFRYPGPKPQTREAGIIMLADTVEAATRSLGEMTPARLANFVHDMIAMRLEDGQLDESTLTFRDLKRIEEAFVRVLVASRHRRVEYPNAPTEGTDAYAVRSG